MTRDKEIRVTLTLESFISNIEIDFSIDDSRTHEDQIGRMMHHMRNFLYSVGFAPDLIDDAYIRYANTIREERRYIAERVKMENETKKDN